MNTAFGALLRHRREMLGLSQAELASRVAGSGESLDIVLLERGEIADLPPGTRHALANALEWPIGLLDVAIGTTTSALSPAQPTWEAGRLMQLRPDDQLETMRKELEAIDALQQELRQWKHDLIDRLHAEQSRYPKDCGGY